MTKQYKAVGIFPNRSETETALRELIKKHGFPSEQVSVIARRKEQSDIDDLDYETKVYGNEASTGAATGILSGGAVGGLTGLLIGLGTIAIPGIGPIMLAGATATAIATTVAGGAIGAAAGSLIGALVGLGIPHEKAEAYRAKVAEGGYLVIIEGTLEEVEIAEDILRERGIEQWEVFDAFETELAENSAENSVENSVENSAQELVEKPIEPHHLRMIGTFPNLAGAKTALLKLIDTGYTLKQVTLFINDNDRHDWFPNLTVCDRLDPSFDRLPKDRRMFFQDCFDRGQYILMVDGTDAEIRDAEFALRTEGIQGFYIIDPHNNNTLNTGDWQIQPLEERSLADPRPLVEIIDRRD